MLGESERIESCVAPQRQVGFKGQLCRAQWSLL